MARRGQQTKDAQLAIRFTDSQIKRLTELAAALGSDNLSGAVRWAVERAPNPSTQRASALYVRARHGRPRSLATLDRRTYGLIPSFVSLPQPKGLFSRENFVQGDRCEAYLSASQHSS